MIARFFLGRARFVALVTVSYHNGTLRHIAEQFWFHGKCWVYGWLSHTRAITNHCFCFCFCFLPCSF